MWTVSAWRWFLCHGTSLCEYLGIKKLLWTKNSTSWWTDLIPGFVFKIKLRPQGRKILFSDFFFIEWIRKLDRLEFNLRMYLNKELFYVFTCSQGPFRSLCPSHCLLSSSSSFSHPPLAATRNMLHAGSNGQDYLCLDGRYLRSNWPEAFHFQATYHCNHAALLTDVTVRHPAHWSFISMHNCNQYPH